MKIFATYLIALIFVFSFSACSRKENKSPLIPDNALSPDLVKNPVTGSENRSDVKVPVFSFKKEINDFGMATERQKVGYSFSLVNTRNAHLVIDNAKSTCG